jgi:UDP-N-acetylmuramoyl-tripeptide--D-alanyl-D-alanine ligase
MDIYKLYSLFLKHPKICTDTRNIVKDSIFFALKGESFNGNKFAEQAINEGCAYAVIDQKEYHKSEKYILVEDTLTTLQELAMYHRQQLNIPIIGITGTNGKTTTKELINIVLSKKYKTHATKGNLNNHIGVPLTILDTPKDTEIAIVEMGANHPGEIALLSKIANPNYGIITNIGRAHLEGFGSFEGILKTKKELYDHIKQSKGYLFINQEDELLINISKEIKRFTYGNNINADSKGKFLQASPFMVMELHSKKGILYVRSKLIGNYNFDNAMAAAAIGRYFKINDLEIKSAIESYIPSNNRSQLMKTDNNIVIVDAYNANPTSMTASINNFFHIKANKKSLILGDMLELGNVSKIEHENIIKLLNENNFNNVYLVGNIFYNTEIKHCFKKFKEVKELVDYLKNNPIKDNTVLIKGSRGIKLEKSIEQL